MRRTIVLALASALAACGGSDTGGEPPPGPPGPTGPRTASPVPAGAPPGVTSFGQTVPALDALGEAFPDQANTWVLDRDFSLAGGYGLQYTTALALYLGAPTSPASHASLTSDLVAGVLEPFPFDQGEAEVTFLTPLYGAADGLRTAAVSDGATLGVPALSGTRSGYLNGTSGSRLSRTVTLSGVSTYTLSWIDAGVLRPDELVGAHLAPYAPVYRVVVRDPSSGAVLDELASEVSDFGVPVPVARTAALPAGLAGPAQISFELRAAAGGYAVVDDVVLDDGTGPLASFDDGDFEAAPGFGPWAAGGAAQSQNVRSGGRSVVPGGGGGPALSVTRTFHAPPGATWARLVDVFANRSGAAVSTSAVYFTSLAGASPRVALAAGGAAVVGWDAEGSARDVAVVSGGGTAHLDPASGDVFAVHALTVPAGGRVALVHFVVQLGRTEGGATAADVPPAVAAEAQSVATGFVARGEPALDLEPGVLDVVANF